MKPTPVADAAASRDMDSVQGRPMSDFRRRLVRGGLASGAALITLTSRPVLAQTCFNPSETMSGALSHKGENIPMCDGQSASTWLADGNTNGGTSWPVPTTTAFHSVFTVGSNGDYGTSTLLDVMNADMAIGPDGMGFLFVGAYLNIMSNRVDARALDVAGLQRIWDEWVVNGSYLPYAGAQPWDMAMIKQYFYDTAIVTA
jgi:hypothetical protein